jgi:hypothetical protein
MGSWLDRGWQPSSVQQDLEDLEPDWLASKIYQTKYLASHDFGYYLVGYQNLPTSYI